MGKYKFQYVYCIHYTIYICLLRKRGTINYAHIYKQHTNDKFHKKISRNKPILTIKITNIQVQNVSLMLYVKYNKMNIVE